MTDVIRKARRRGLEDKLAEMKKNNDTWALNATKAKLDLVDSFDDEKLQVMAQILTHQIQGNDPLAALGQIMYELSCLPDNKKIMAQVVHYALLYRDAAKYNRGAARKVKEEVK